MRIYVDYQLAKEHSTLVLLLVALITSGQFGPDHLNQNLLIWLVSNCFYLILGKKINIFLDIIP